MGIPCPCGCWEDSLKPCTCSAGTVTKYQKRISGPLLDRIDPKRSDHIEVPQVEADKNRPYEKLSDQRLGKSSESVRQRVEAAREWQRQRFTGVDGVACNADMRPADVRKHCALEDTGQSLMRALQNSVRR